MARLLAKLALPVRLRVALNSDRGLATCPGAAVLVWRLRFARAAAAHGRTKM